MLSYILSLRDVCLFTDMVTKDVDRSLIRREATKNQDVWHVTSSQENTDLKTWQRMLQDELLEEVNYAKVKLNIDLFLPVTVTVVDFYARQHTCYSAYMLLPIHLSVRMSVCLSVTRVDHSKMVEVRIMQFSSHSSHISLVLWDKFHPEILMGSPKQGR